MPRKIRILIGALLASCHTAFAQTPPSEPAAKTTESVIVTAAGSSKEQIEKFVQQYAAASSRIDRLARWENVICPVTLGLPSDQNQAVSTRIREVAAMVGAGESPKGKCSPRIIVIFTAQPQDLMDAIKRDYPRLLGRHYYSQTERVSRMAHPAQAWYGTATQDTSGYVASDTDRHGEPAEGQTFSSTGLIGFDGLSSRFQSILIVVDLNDAAGHQLAALSDYVAMLALSQTQASDACQPLSSITNLLSKNCNPSDKSGSITDMDIAYLKALYSISPTSSFHSQKSRISTQIEQSLGQQQ
ncbi:MAG TPA: hypothetical protein VNY75_08455 [Rhizomicrobium sp.]|jgi:hypothetical protein|nr:hypothetical protein [Rhizomicrobium sp.]